MTVGFHPVFDNPIRMAYFPGWKSIGALIERLGDLEHAVGEGRVVPAPWEPYQDACPRCRFASAYAWARNQLEEPRKVALALALFPGDEEQLATRSGHAKWLILATKSEPSHITRKLMIAEALELWESKSADWLEQVVQTCADLGIEASVGSLHDDVRHALLPLTKAVENEESTPELQQVDFVSRRSRGFDKELLGLDGWTPDPGLVILPVDGAIHSLAREILLLDTQNVVLLRARKTIRTVPWNKVTLVHQFECSIIFEIADEPSLIIAGYKDPQKVVRTLQDLYRTATERILQALAAHVIRASP